nr:isochorismatase family protein [Tissierella sp.]
MEKFKLAREDSLLFVIDIQERLAPAIKDSDIVISNTLTLLKAAELMNIEKIATEQYPKGLGNTIALLKEYIKDEQVFSKVEFSACIDEVKNYIKKSNKNKIILTGMETHVCVYQTARDLLDMGLDVYIVRDAVGSRTEINYLNGLDLLKEMGCIITNTETVLFDLLQKAGTEEFKTISKLIK